MAVAHTIASALYMTRAAVPQLAAVIVLLRYRQQQRFGDGRGAYNSVGSWGDSCSGANARCSNDAAALTAAVALKRWPSRIR